MTNRMRWWVTAAVTCAVAAPAVWPHAADGFPISTYPMFTSERGREVALDTAVLVRDGARERLSPEAIGGTDEIVLASVTVSNAIRRGEAAELCREIADRVTTPGTVEVVTEVHDAIALLRDDAEPLAVHVHHRCPAR